MNNLATANYKTFIFLLLGTFFALATNDLQAQSDEQRMYTECRGKSSNTAEAECLIRYLNKYPNGRFAAQAIEELKALGAYEQYRCDQAKKGLTQYSFEKFKRDFPGSICVAGLQRELDQLDAQLSSRIRANPCDTSAAARYLKVFSDYKNSSLASERLNSFRSPPNEDTFWQKRTGSIPGVRLYMCVYPQGQYYAEAEKRIARADELAYQSAIRENTTNSLRDYLAVFPNGKYSRQVRDLLSSGTLRERSPIQIVWSRLPKYNVDSLRSFAAAYSTSEYADSAKIVLKQRDDELWKKVVVQASLAAIQLYIKTFPNGIHILEAKEQLKLLSNSREDDLYEIAYTTSDEEEKVDKLIDYLKEYPEGKYAEDVKDLINQLDPIKHSYSRSDEADGVTINFSNVENPRLDQNYDHEVILVDDEKYRRKIISMSSSLKILLLKFVFWMTTGKKRQ
ncbi:MAG: hypothetical protein AAFO07_14370 [Bacteroidota bacterium]